MTKIQELIDSKIYELYEKENLFLKNAILDNTYGISLEIAEKILSDFFYIEKDFNIEQGCLTLEMKPLPIENVLHTYDDKNGIQKKILKIYNRKVNNMGFTIKDLKELIKDAPDDLPIEVVGRYYGQEDMVMTDVGIDEESLWFELGYECDRAGYLE